MALCALTLAACTGGHKPGTTPVPGQPATVAAGAATSPSPANAARVKRLVERFGRRLKQVSTLAPPDDLRRALKRSYGGLVTPQLLQAWLADPRSAPGKDVSSPWPENINIETVRCPSLDRCHVTGEIRYVTSVEMAHGGTAATRGIKLDMLTTGNGWRINAVHMQSLKH